MHFNIKQYPQLFEKPSGLGHFKAEYLYSTLFSGLPSRLVVQDPLDIDKISPFVQQNFERVMVDFAYHGGSLHETAYWQGLGKYTETILEVSESQHSKFAGVGVGVLGNYFDSADYETELVKNEVTTCSVNLISSNIELLKELCEHFSAHISKKASKIHLLTNSYGEASLQPLDVPPAKVDLHLNYGEEFVAVHNEVINSLNNKLSGLYLFYGEPGTGKSSYIKYLLTAITTRKIVYVPINLIDSLVSPDFLPLLIANRNLILVIEDAEKALVSREENTGNSSIVSAILNLTDSFIGNALNVTIMATFNTKKDNLDKALLRKGRLKLSHEFKKLSIEAAQKLIDSLQFDYQVTEPMSLAEIYYLYDDNKFKGEDAGARVIGFGKT